MEHTFDIKIAEKYSVNAAILYRNFQYWIAHNKANKKHLIDGRTWSYNSQRAFKDLFPYMTRAHIRGALKVLIEKGVIIAGRHNKRCGDQTTWYAFEDEKTALKDLPAHWLNSPMVGENSQPNGGINQSIGENRQALPDTKPIPKPDNKPDKNSGVVDSAEDILRLDFEIAEQRKFLMEEIEQYLHPGLRSARTLARIVKYFVNSAQGDPPKIAWFKEAVEWARTASMSNATNKIGLFVAKVKQATGYKAQSNLLDRKGFNYGTQARKEASQGLDSNNSEDFIG